MAAQIIPGSYGAYRATQFILQEISLSEFLLTRGVGSALIFIEEPWFHYFVGVLYNTIADRRVRFTYVSEKPFRANAIDWHLLSEFGSQSLRTANIADNDAVLLFSPAGDEALRLLRESGVEIYSHSQINWLMYEYAFYIRPLADFAYKHPKVTVVSFNRSLKILRMNRETPGNLSENEQLILGNKFDRKKLYEGLGLTEQDIKDITSHPRSFIDSMGIKRYYDVRSRCLNIENGHRVTAAQPSEYDRTVWFVGNCLVYGINCTDNNTFASVTQARFNNLGMKVRVENYGVFANSDGESPFRTLNALPIKDNDIVLFSVNDLGINHNVWYNTLDIANLFMRPHGFGEVFSDQYHYNDRGYRAIGDVIFEYLKENGFFETTDRSEEFSKLPAPYSLARGAFGIPLRRDGEQSQSESDAALREYKASLNAHRLKIGAAVMNCNPFTRGHRCLVEYAAAQVAWLYVFVVEEDKSVFPFDDRLALVREGTKDLRNVTVLPSGKFIISSLTFTDYFNKSELQDRTVDPTRDVELFGRHIAPALGITVRFAGEEPLDKVTRQYNEAMRDILPRYGVEFVEIPRREEAGEPISASRVRKLLEAKDFDGIKRLVPDTTFEYLMKFAGGGGR